jgi:iron complex outermembrane receptor protein
MRLWRNKRVVAIAYALCVCNAAGLGSVWAQDQRIVVTVTGSNIIPQIEGETALPMQVITRADIERANIQTAAELLKTVSANMSYGSFNEVLQTAGSSQPGLAGASLRGLTLHRTLILFNGRRIANYAFTGNAVDLNVIPVAAIERVEVLKDGASAIYGSDAIGGVVNFIMRTNYQGAEASAQYSSPEHTGGYSNHFNASAGYGDLGSQKFNAFAMVDYQQLGGIIANDRSFARTSYIPSEGLDQTSVNSFPGNVDTPTGTRNPTGDPNNAYQNPSCEPPLSFPTKASPTQCRFDYVRGVDIVAQSERLNLLGTFTWQIDPDNQFFLNGNYARNRFIITGPPTSIANTTTFQAINHFFLPPTSAFYPHAFAQFFGIDGRPLNIHWRSVELGPRTDAPIVEQSNFVAGMQGVVRGWNYNGAFTYSESKITDRYVDGYVKESAIIPILNSGVVNPFGFNTPDVVALLSTAKINGTVRTGKGSLSSVDFHASNEIAQMSAGPLAIALGLEARQWKLRENSGSDLSSGNIVQVGAISSLTATRNVWVGFAEANAPIVKTLEANLAVRYDHYSDVGATTNPKLSIRWQPNKTLLLRASVGTGFGAPGLEGLYAPPILGTTPSQSDPARCPVTNSPQDCNRNFPSEFGGNPLLKSEKSVQWGFGGVWAPVPGLSLGADYFDVLVKSEIFGLNSQTVFQLCPDGVNGSTCEFIHRGPVDPAFPALPGPIVLVDQTLFNVGKVRVTGIDVNAEYRFPKLDWGQFKLSLQGTYNIMNLQQQTNGSYINLVNHYSQSIAGGVIPYWVHYLVLDWDYGPWSATLTQNYQQGTYDQNPNPNTSNQQRVAGDYEIWNLSGSYSGFKHWTLSVGIKNLIDRNPPFSNQTLGGAFAAATGYDPTYADPHGRLYWASIKYVFK